MPNIQQLESKKKQEWGQQLRDLSRDLYDYATGNMIIDYTARNLENLGKQLQNGSSNFSDVSNILDKLYYGGGSGWPKSNGFDRLQTEEVQTSYGTKKEYPADLKPLADRLYKLTREFSTPRDESVAKYYKAGTMGHGILQAIASRRGALSKELKAYFPTLNDSSTLTHMRREGLIQKDGATTAPWQLTDLGKQLLKERGAYTLNMYQKANQYSATPKNILPWEMPAQEHAEFVAAQCSRNGRNYC